MNIKVGNYELRPYSNNLCWELFKFCEIKDRKTNECRMDWKSLGKYPVTLEEGLLTIYESMLRDEDITTDMDGALRAARKIRDEIRKAVKK